jgi:hypothetical protein
MLVSVRSEVGKGGGGVGGGIRFVGHAFLKCWKVLGSRKFMKNKKQCVALMHPDTFSEGCQTSIVWLNRSAGNEVKAMVKLPGALSCRLGLYWWRRYSKTRRATGLLR